MLRENKNFRRNPNFADRVMCPYCGKYILETNIEHPCLNKIYALNHHQKRQLLESGEKDYPTYILNTNKRKRAAQEKANSQLLNLTETINDGTQHK